MLALRVVRMTPNLTLLKTRQNRPSSFGKFPNRPQLRFRRWLGGPQVVGNSAPALLHVPALHPAAHASSCGTYCIRHLPGLNGCRHTLSQGAAGSDAAKRKCAGLTRLTTVRPVHITSHVIARQPPFRTCRAGMIHWLQRTACWQFGIDLSFAACHISLTSNLVQASRHIQAGLALCIGLY